MSSHLNPIQLEELQTAIERQDPAFLDLLTNFLNQEEPPLEGDAPAERITFYDLRRTLSSPFHLCKIPPGEGRMLWRKQKWEQYLSQSYPLLPRLALDQVLIGLYEQQGEWGRQMLLRLIPNIRLLWGPWRAIKQIFKRAEEQNDYELFGAIAARLDCEYAEYPGYSRGDVTKQTLLYLRRRAWRYLRRLGQHIPALYPYAAVQLMRWYPDWQDDWSGKQKLINLWILNHVFYHEHSSKSGKKIVRKYGRNKFKYRPYYDTIPEEVSKHRAYPETWKTSADPLLDLLMLCQADRVAQFAIELLKEYFGANLRDLDLQLLIRLGERSFRSVQQFVKGLIEENPAWQKARFRELGLHDLMVGSFLFSEDEEVRTYAIAYARDYASDLAIETIFKLLRTSEDDLREFALQLLEKRDARKDLGLETIQRLFLMDAAREIATKKLKEGFRPSEIPLEWFSPLLFHNDWSMINFTLEYLRKEFPSQQLEVSWFQSLLRDPRLDRGYYSYMVRDYAMENLQKQAAKLDGDWLKQALLNDNTRYSVQNWITEGKISKAQIDLEWVKDLLDAERWRQSAWVKRQKESSEAWTKNLSYPDGLRYFAIQYLNDVKRFTPQEIGIDWLLGLLDHKDVTCQNFAQNYLLTHINPADLASEEDLLAMPKTAIPVEAAQNPFAGKSFLFTGKLRHLTRKQAEDKVVAIDGENAKSVTKKLDYLVVGDEGSPLYSEGKKGDKQVKAEKLKEEGAGIQIISETEWLRMISEGGAAKADVDQNALMAGFQRLYRLVTEGEVSQTKRTFAIQYMKARHPVLGPHQSGQPLEGIQVIPRHLFKPELFLTLIEDERSEVQTLALHIARFELRRWKVAAEEIFKLCESQHRAVRQFALASLLGPTDPDTIEEYYFRPEELDPDLVFALTESRRRPVRQTGMTLLSRHYDLLHGDERILRLAESADRDIRTEAIHLLWMRYRSPSISLAWAPTQDKRAKVRPDGSGVNAIANLEIMLDFVRAALFNVPPGRLEKRPENAPRPIPNIKAKQYTIDLLRDLALQDEPFAKTISPLLRQFLASGHKGESLSCLVALTQISHRWPQSISLMH